MRRYRQTHDIQYKDNQKSNGRKQNLQTHTITIDRQHRRNTTQNTQQHTHTKQFNKTRDNTMTQTKSRNT